MKRISVPIIFASILISAETFKNNLEELRKELAENAAIIYTAHNYSNHHDAQNIYHDDLRTLLTENIDFLVRSKHFDAYSDINIDDLIDQTVDLIEYYRCNQLSSAGQRIWDEAVSIQDLALTIESKLDLIDRAAFISTITMLEQTNSLVSVMADTMNQVLSSLDILQTEITTVNISTQTITEQLSVITQELIGIEVNDFGGTWTSLELTQEIINQGIAFLTEEATTSNTLIDTLIESNISQFYTVFSEVSVLLYATETTMTTVAYLTNLAQNQLISVLSVIDQTTAEVNNSITLLDQLQLQLLMDFSGTFTAIQSIQNTMNDTEIKLENIVMSFANTDILLQPLVSSIITINSKTDNLLYITQTILEQASYVDLLF